MADDTLLLYHPGMLEHRPGGFKEDHPEWLTPTQVAALEELAQAGSKWSHPERPERLASVVGWLESKPIEGVRWAEPAPAPRVALERAHGAAYVEAVEGLRGLDAWLNPDTTAVSPRSVEAAELAAGAAMRAAEAVVRGEQSGGAKRAMALVRPPGHHTSRPQPRGFCLYNNVAVAAQYARAELGLERVLIIDWDAHHGNGTQDLFYEDGSVLLFDTHLDGRDFYPGTGALEETGRGAGVGATVNVPLPQGSGDSTVLAAFERVLVPIADLFRPELVLVSAGFDAHGNDLNMSMTEGGFAALCGFVCGIADRHAGGRLALTLEGGYNYESLSRSVRACVEVLARGTGGAGAAGEVTRVEEPGLEAVERAAAFHGVGR